MSAKVDADHTSDTVTRHEMIEDRFLCVSELCSRLLVIQETDKLRIKFFWFGVCGNEAVLRIPARTSIQAPNDGNPL
jgi:hypothetical protein